MIYAIGDIHGMLDPLKVLADYLYERKAKGENISRVIFLGDLIDCGPCSREVTDLILQLQKDFPVTVLLGNHEEMMLSYYHKSFNQMKSGNMWLGYNGGVSTVRSFYPDSLLFKNGLYPDEKTVAEALFYQDILKLDERYETFFSNLTISLKVVLERTERHQELLFSHSVPSPRYDLSLQTQAQTWADLHKFMDESGCALDETIIWNRQLLTRQASDDLIVVHGHTPTRYYRQMTKLIRFWEEEDNAPYVVREKKSRQLVQIDIDTGLIYGGSLTMLAVDDTPDAANIFPYYISVDPKRGFRHKLYSLKELSLL
jgi:serine/threonine protein phosphatase 1